MRWNEVLECAGLQLLNERGSRELEQMQQKNSKLQQDCEQLSADKERLSLDNLQNTNELKVNTRTHSECLCTTGMKSRYEMILKSQLRLQSLDIPSMCMTHFRLINLLVMVANNSSRCFVGMRARLGCSGLSLYSSSCVCRASEERRRGEPDEAEDCKTDQNA